MTLKAGLAWAAVIVLLVIAWRAFTS